MGEEATADKLEMGRRLLKTDEKFVSIGFQFISTMREFYWHCRKIDNDVNQYTHTHTLEQQIDAEMNKAAKNGRKKGERETVNEKRE